MLLISPTFEILTDFLAFLRVRVDLKPGDMNILCLQGTNPISNQIGKLEINNNAFNIYNDTIAVAFTTKNNEHRYLLLLGTVDPGAAYINAPGGEAHLTFGQHFYVRGKHHGKPALRALDEINRVWRDPDKNHIPSADDYVATGKFGVNIHPGGSLKTIGNWSAGCINICGGWEGTPWITFMELVTTHFKHNSDVGVTVWRGQDLFQFESEKQQMKPTLSFGILNPWVADLQHALTTKGFFSGTLDGNWQNNTEKAVRQFQESVGIKPDGIVGQITWSKLLA